MIKSTLVRIEVCMMFSSPKGMVPSGFEDFPNQGGVYEIPITSMMVKPGKQADSGSPALRGIICLGVANAISG